MLTKKTIKELVIVKRDENMDFEEVEIDNGFWKPETSGDTLEGTIVSMEDGLFGLTVTLASPNGDEYVLPSHKNLQLKLSQLSEGDFVRIVFKGEQENTRPGHNNTRIYQVFHGKRRAINENF
jgi:hypothetical protein